jgi:hypothetical protein
LLRMFKSWGGSWRFLMAKGKLVLMLLQACVCGCVCKWVRQHSNVHVLPSAPAGMQLRVPYRPGPCECSAGACLQDCCAVSCCCSLVWMAWMNWVQPLLGAVRLAFIDGEHGRDDSCRRAHMSAAGTTQCRDALTALLCMLLCTVCHVCMPGEVARDMVVLWCWSCA